MAEKGKNYFVIFVLFSPYWSYPHLNKTPFFQNFLKMTPFKIIFKKNKNFHRNDNKWKIEKNLSGHYMEKTQFLPPKKIAAFQPIFIFYLKPFQKHQI